MLERRAHPVREAAFKVGESTVEIGAHYFADVLGFREHLETEQIRKFGFRFFFSEGRDDIDRCTELGVSQLLPTPSWQLDRGRFENFLGEQARALGVEFRDGAVVRGVELGSGDARARGDVRARRQRSARWPRAGWSMPPAAPACSSASSAWPRPTTTTPTRCGGASTASSIPNQWSDDPQWLARCTPPDRWRSTNHMCGPGYWFWLIPLASGAHSLGIVCDAKMHPLETMNTHDKAMAWLREHQPQVAALARQARARAAGLPVPAPFLATAASRCSAATAGR